MAESRFSLLSLRSLPSLVSLVALSLLLLGCDQQPAQPPADRREDPQYRAEMARLAEDQRDSAKRLEAVRRQIAQLQAEEARLVGEIEAKRREARQKADARRAQEKANGQRQPVSQSPRLSVP